MERGTSIGGIVRDEQGRPIEGVTVSLYDNSPKDRDREALDFDEITARTDAQGRWHLDLIPAGFDLGHLHFSFSHPEFLSSDRRHQHPAERDARATPEAERRDRLAQGNPVTGRVLDRDGRPIAGASVRLGRSVLASPTTKTEAEGQFRIGNTAAGESFADRPGRRPRPRDEVR